ncbi:MAG: hypothetical protein J6X18_02085 [Bacteroidales bacterium]|nr:hypothetical protein [Bacteroidales bacterium]
MAFLPFNVSINFSGPASATPGGTEYRGAYLLCVATGTTQAIADNQYAGTAQTCSVYTLPVKATDRVVLEGSNIGTSLYATVWAVRPGSRWDGGGNSGIAHVQRTTATTPTVTVTCAYDSTRGNAYVPSTYTTLLSENTLPGYDYLGKSYYMKDLFNGIENSTFVKANVLPVDYITASKALVKMSTLSGKFIFRNTAGTLFTGTDRYSALRWMHFDPSYSRWSYGIDLKHNDYYYVAADSSIGYIEVSNDTGHNLSTGVNVSVAVYTPSNTWDQICYFSTNAIGPNGWTSQVTYSRIKAGAWGSKIGIQVSDAVSTLHGYTINIGGYSFDGTVNQGYGEHTMDANITIADSIYLYIVTNPL